MRKAIAFKTSLLIGLIILLAGAFIVPRVNSADLDQGLVDYWNFNECSGSILHDSSGNGNNGTISGAAWGTNGICGCALEFVNTNIVRFIPSSWDNSITTALTITAWVKWYGPSAIPRDCIIFDGRGDAPQGLVFGIVRSDSMLIFHMHQGSGSTIKSRHPIPTDTFTHVAVVFDDVSNTLRLFINGVQDNTVTTTDSYNNSDHQAAIGNNHWAPGDGQWAPINGILDEVRIYDRALSNIEIKELHDMCAPPPSIPTLTEWGMIIFGVLLLGFITFVFLKRRKATVSLR